jgi:hypothetical protein
MVKRARKYYLGVTTITQDVEDFLHNDFGKAIVTNASSQFLMKQSTASIPVLAETFYLSQGERQLLVATDIGEGIFFAGQNHVALRVVASDEEHQVITTDPEELYQKKQDIEAKRLLDQQNLKSATEKVRPQPAYYQSERSDKKVLSPQEENDSLNTQGAPDLNSIDGLPVPNQSPLSHGNQAQSIDDYKSPT